MAVDPLTGPSASPVLHRPLVTAACMMAVFMAAVEVTIVATAMPTIVSDLGGARLFSWVFAAYLLTTAVTTPIYGRLADIYGRKRVFFVGCVVFLAGSAACGLVSSMTALILFRTLQGLGAGSIQSVATTIIGDIYPGAERARAQSWMSAIWAIAAVIGPALGAFIVQHLHWSFVFWINVPIGAASIALLALFLHETVRPRQHSIDYLGSALLIIGLGAIMTAVVQAQSLAPTAMVALVVAGVVALAWLFVQERRVPEPMIPIALWRNRAVAVGNFGSLVVGALLICVVAFVPTNVQAVMGLSAMVAGTVVGSLSVAWSGASVVAGRLMMRMSYRTTGILGSVVLVAGAAVLTVFDSVATLGWLAAGTLLIGLGMGFCTLVFLLVAQSSVDWNERGVATASVLFTRTLGQAVGAGLGGAILNFGIAHRAPGVADALDRLLQPAARAHLGAERLAQLIAAVSGSLHDVYTVTGFLALATLIAALLLPRHLHLNKQGRG